MHKSFAIIIICTGLLFPYISFAIDTSLVSNLETLVSQIPDMIPNDQSFCAIDQTGKTIFSFNEQKKIIPASVSKLYTEDFALHTLGYDYTYTTRIIRNGNTLYINGAMDPFFTDGDLKKVILFTQRDFGEKKISKIVYTNLYFNWSTNNPQTKLFLQKFIQNKKMFDKKTTVTYSPTKYIGPGKKYTYTSPPLSVLFKQMNIFSTNSSSHALFMQLGGTEAFQKYMKKTYDAGPETISFETGSGLDGNTTTCILTAHVTKHIHDYLIKNSIRVENFLAVPGIDGGPIRNRFMSLLDKKKILFKPGFVYNHETLAGVMKTNKGYIYFGVYTDYPNRSDERAVRTLVETFTQLIADHVGALPFDYKPKIYDQNNWSKVKKI
jgi:D-alanyl-D-alanine carboxypeptidase